MSRIPHRAARLLLGAVLAVGLAGCDLAPPGVGLSAPAGVPAPPPTAPPRATLAAPVPPTAAPAAPPTLAATGASPAALAYLTYAVDSIQQHGLHSDQVDWPAVRRHALDVASGAQIPADTYPAIDYVLTQLPVNGHSTLLRPDKLAQRNAELASGLGLRLSYAERKVVAVDAGGVAERAGLRAGDTIVSVNDATPASLGAMKFFAQLYFVSGVKLAVRRGADLAVSARLDHEAVDPGALARGRRLAGNIGYIAVPALDGGSPLVPYYPDIMQQIIADIDQTPTCGWVVDLQGNTGGQIWPMLAGIGPVLGEGRVGSFTPPGDSAGWSYRDGQALLSGIVSAQAPAPYHLRRPDPPVAVLTDGQTGSAGEAVAVAFRGRPGARSFGAATNGVPTGNVGIPLSDGAALQLTMVMDVDRTGHAYDAPIPPDVAVPTNRFRQGTDKDPVVQAGVAWLRQQPACAGP
jgi:carboxyl-terminal processing protease